MRAVVVVTDSEALQAFERALIETGQHGFTVIPKIWGRGRKGLKTGDRVHPGGSSLLFSVVPEEDSQPTVALLRDVRDRTGVADSTKIFIAPVEAAD